MDTRKKVLVVDDEAQIIRVLRHILNAHGYAVHAAEDGEAALDEFDDWQPDLVLADLQMPNVDGIELTRRIRVKSDVPIVILSVRNDEKTIVNALDIGADDYITKPFGSDELLARLRSALRRVPERTPDKLEAGDFKIDVGAHTVHFRNEPLRLTPKEFDLLLCFLQNSGRVLTHSFLLRKVWGDYYTEQPEALRVLVASLRKKIEPDPADPTYLHTEPWVGYRFDSDAK